MIRTLLYANVSRACICPDSAVSKLWTILKCRCYIRNSWNWKCGEYRANLVCIRYTYSIQFFLITMVLWSLASFNPVNRRLHFFSSLDKCQTDRLNQLLNPATYVRGKNLISKRISVGSLYIHVDQCSLSTNHKLA